MIAGMVQIAVVLAAEYWCWMLVLAFGCTYALRPAYGKPKSDRKLAAVIDHMHTCDCLSLVLTYFGLERSSIVLYHFLEEKLSLHTFGFMGHWSKYMNLYLQFPLVTTNCNKYK